MSPGVAVGGVAFNSPTYIVASDDEIDAVVGGRPSRWALNAHGKFYGMARSSFRRRRVAGGSGGGRGLWLWRQSPVLGVDLGKNVCSVVGLTASGAVVMRRKVRRETLIGLAQQLPPCVVGMEAVVAPITRPPNRRARP